MTFPSDASPDPDALPAGRIDLHSHLIPGIDDGCQTFDESRACIDMLREAGYVGSLCTPHVWREMFPANLPGNIEPWTEQLQHWLGETGIDYAVWPGGEVRLFEDIVDWFQHNGVPTLAGSRYILADFWTPTWPDWLDPTMDWLLEQGYKPILAHPERTTDQFRLLERLRALHDRGVLLQGNCLPYTGAEGRDRVRVMKQLLKEDRYDFIALDMHGADSLPDRLKGLDQLRKAIGDDRLNELTCDAPRRVLRDGIAQKANTPR
jgi:protein-tyrosine phosphatase